MKQGKAIYNLLSSASAVTDIVANRIYPLRVPDKTAFPCITYQTISNVPYNSKSGFTSYQSRVQVNVFENDYNNAFILSDAIKTALADKVGTFGGVVVQGTKFLNQIDQEEDFADGFGLVHFILDFNITYNE